MRRRFSHLNRHHTFRRRAQSFRRAFVRLFHLLLLLFLVGTSGAYAETITGTVTNTVPAGLLNVTVEAFDTTTGLSVATTLTDAAGAYTLTLPAGSYFVRTFNTAHYINQLYDSAGNLQCVGLCNLNVGTAVDVPPGGAIAGINFMLAIGATITGTVRDEDTGVLLGGIRVAIVLPGGLFVDEAFTAADGTYSTSNGFPTGNYHALTDDNSQGYINETFGGAPCLQWPICSRLSATNVAVVAGAVRANVNFALRRGGRYSGHVRDNGTGLGLEGIEVTVLNAAGQNYGRTFTNAAGDFTTGRGLPTGSFFLRTTNTAGYINTFNDGTVCVGSCSVATIEPIPVIQPDTVSDVDFSLDAGGRVAGTVRDATTLEPLPNVDVQIVTSTGAQLTTGFTDATGNYVSRDGLPTGTYFVRTASISPNALGGYIHKLYDNVTCAAGCTPTLGAPVAVAAGLTTSFIDFDLERGGQVTGTLRDAATGLAISSATATVFNAAGTVLSTGSVDIAGRYLTVAGLIPGSYFLRVTNGVGFINEVYPDVACIGNVCPPGSGSLVAVDANSVTTVDMDLVRGSRFRGTILDSSGAVVTGATVAVLDASGQTLTTTGAVDALGAYLTGPGFPAGSYFARTNNSVGYINELYTDVACHFGCAVATGTPIPLPGGNVTTTNINFTLDLGGQVTGHVTSEGTGLPLANVTVLLFNPVTQTSISATTDSTGEYVVRGLPDGVYYARTTNTLGYVNEAFDNIACVFACSNTTLGQPLAVVAAGTLIDVDFELRAGGRVSGKVIDAATALPLSGVTVSIVEPTGATAATATSDLSGNYVTGAGILSGNYFATTGNSAGYQNELYNDIRCNGPCTIAAGASFAVTEGATTPGIDFSLDRGGRVSGQVTDAATGTPLQGVTVAVPDSSGRQVATATSDAGGNYITGAGVSAGTYYARTTNAIGFVDELYNDRPCPTGCPIVGGNTFGVAAGSTTPGIHFALVRGGRIAGVVTNESTGQPLGSVTVQIFDATAQLFTTAVTNAFGVYTSNAGLPSGTYYARTVNSLGYLNELFGGLPCAAGCLVTGGTPIVVASPDATTGRDFALSPGGRVAGRVTDTLGAPLRNVTVSIRDASGTSLVTGITNAAGDYITAQGLPSGDYFVRTTNALGYINQLHASPSPIPCVGNCDVTAGTLVHVDLGVTTMDIDFALEAGARVRGIVTRTDGTPIPNVTVSIVNALGVQVASGVTDGTGTYVTGTGFPTGNYFAVTQNTQGFVNKIFDNIPCIGSCTPTTGTAVLAVAGTTTPGIDFVLEPDTDPDLDGIAATVDTLPAAFSNDFTDVPLGGTTSGTISSRSGWTALVGDITPGGVQLQIVGVGAAGAAARFDVCPLGDPERATLDVLGEIASVSCNPVTGSTTISALAATPIIQLRDPVVGPGLVASLTTGQSVTMGSPVTASSTNTQSIGVQFVDANGTPFGSFDLDPGEAVDALVNSDGSVDATVLQGTVTMTVRDETVTLQLGDEHAFPPIEIQIVIDIKPGDSATNPINLKANGVIPVAILSDARFDATTADPASLRFSGASVAKTTRGAFRTSVADVNGDGRFDIVVQFETQGLLLTPPDTVGVVTGQTANGLLFRGTDTVQVK